MQTCRASWAQNGKMSKNFNHGILLLREKKPPLFDKKKPPLSSRLKQGFLHIFCKKCSVSVFPIQPPLKTYLCILWLLYWFVSTGHYLFHRMLWRSWPILAWKEPSEAKHTLVLCRGFGLGLLLFCFLLIFFFCHHIALGLVLVSSSCTMMMTTMKTIPCGGATCRPLAEKMKFVQSCIEETL